MGLRWNAILNSSNVGHIARDESTGDIYVQFLDGSIYRYPYATQQHWDDLLKAESKGRYVHRVLQKECGYQKVADRIRKDNEPS
jgi:hypothetical protein